MAGGAGPPHVARALLPRSFHRIQELAKKRSHTISLGHLMWSTSSEPASLIQQGRWLREQLPIRLARRLDEFLQLPYVVVMNPHFNKVLEIYLETFDRVTAFPEISSAREEAAFSELIRGQLAKQARSTGIVSEGYRQIRSLLPHVRLDTFLNNFFITRVSSRILCENYVVMRNPREGYVGVVQRDLQPRQVVESFVGPLTELTQSIYGVAPEVQLRGNLGCVLDYIPGHVSFMVRELLKNAIRATVERHLVGGPGRPAPPPVVVELQKGDSHVIIKISDQGGGMPKHVQREAWQYGWSSVEKEAGGGTGAWATGAGAEDERKKEIAGFGFGLPLTRLHAQYFGGDVFMVNIANHGTNMYLLLNHLQEGSPSVESEDPSTALTQFENSSLNSP
mmetsp:Transcript_128518/g.363722  ORF Transcript_128518/g.363722 Transcript_128518/m.363722 type:complete len:393 (-) Transcript_128518:53-1231(-)